jgi:hypothetical protein
MRRTPRASAIRTSSAGDFACILRMTLPRCFTVLTPGSPAMSLFLSPGRHQRHALAFARRKLVEVCLQLRAISRMFSTFAALLESRAWTHLQ